VIFYACNYKFGNALDNELKQRVERLYEKYKDNVYSYVYSRVFDKSAVEDIVHDIFVKVVAKINTYDEHKASESTWLFVITKNTVLDYYKTRHSKNPIEELTETLPSDMDVDDCVEKNEQNRRLMDALDKLKPVERDIVILRYFYGYHSTEIAGMLNMTHGHVRIMCMRTLQKLNKILGGGVDNLIQIIQKLKEGAFGTLFFVVI
ncbi:MAG: RNA polymerase sigma factor, partial [Clostridia bacterium]|nr:RNA polymerase sigma factor [Clostridia bacterium]